MNSHSFNVYRNNPNSLILSNAGKLFWSWYPNYHILVQKEKENVIFHLFMSSLKCETRHSHVIISHAVAAKTLQKACSMCRVVIFVYAFLKYWLPSSSYHLKLPNNTHLTQAMSGKLNLVTGKHLVFPTYWYLFKHEITH